jgi:hypothetical protein
MNTAALPDDPHRHLSPVWSRYSDIVVERGEGAVQSVEGN